MSRSEYTEDGENWEMIKWRGQVASAIRGKRGQALLRELLEALDAMAEKRLIAGALIDRCGGVCALGALGRKRGVELEKLDPWDYDTLAGVFGVAHQLVREIEFTNDDAGRSPEDRWKAMRYWVAAQIKPTSN